MEPHRPATQRQRLSTLQNRFTSPGSLRYSTRRDACGRSTSGSVHQWSAAIATFELKNSLTKQTVDDAVEQYRRDRDPREPLFAFGRCVVHFAVDDGEVQDVH